MSARSDVNGRAGERAPAVALGNARPVPVVLAKWSDAAHGMMLSRVLPGDAGSRLDVAAFTSSI